MGKGTNWLAVGKVKGAERMGDGRRETRSSIFLKKLSNQNVPCSSNDLV